MAFYVIACIGCELTRISCEGKFKLSSEFVVFNYNHGKYDNINVYVHDRTYVSLDLKENPMASNDLHV